MSRFTLKQLRVLAGYTQKQVAEILETSNTTIFNWEQGKSFPKQPQIEKLCELYGCTYDTIDFTPPKKI